MPGPTRHGIARVLQSQLCVSRQPIQNRKGACLPYVRSVVPTVPTCHRSVVPTCHRSDMSQVGSTDLSLSAQLPMSFAIPAEAAQVQSFTYRH